MKRLPTDYTELVREYESVFSDDDLVDIENKSEIMTFDEVLDYMMIEQDELSDTDVKIAKKIHRRGALKGVYNQFKELKGNAGAEFYLRKMASQMADTSDQAALKSLAGGFQLNINAAGKPITESGE